MARPMGDRPRARTLVRSGADSAGTMESMLTLGAWLAPVLGAIIVVVGIPATCSHRQKSRASALPARSHATPAAHKDRSQRSTCMPCDGTVASDGPPPANLLALPEVLLVSHPCVGRGLMQCPFKWPARCCAQISPFGHASDDRANDQAAARSGGSARGYPAGLASPTARS